MKNKKIILGLLFSSILPLTGCNDTSISSHLKLSIVGNNNVGINEYITLKAFVDDEENEDVSWSSSDKQIATISSTGIVKGLKEGKVTITAKKDNLEDSIEIEVHESYRPFNVVQKFINKPYQVETKSNTINYNEKYYNDSYYFTSKSNLLKDSFGYGKNKDDLCFEYNIVNNEVQNAMLLRNETSDYRSITYDIDDLSIANFSSFNLNNENIYELSDNSKNVFSYSLLQNFKDEEEKNNYLNSLTSVKLKITSGSTFDIEYKFSSYEDIVSSYFLLQEKNTLLNSYLENGSVLVPEVYLDITEIVSKIENMSYACDMNSIKKDDGTIISMGVGYFNKDYLYYDYTDEYLEYFNSKSEEKLTDQILINIKNKSSLEDGVYIYSFDNDNITLKKKYDESNETDYHNLFFNLNWVFSSLKNNLYNFEPIQTNQYTDSSYKEYFNNSLKAALVCYDLFEEYILGFTGADLDCYPVGLVVSYNKEKVDVAGVMYIEGQGTVAVYQNTPFYNFNKNSFPVIDNYISNIK